MLDIKTVMLYTVIYNYIMGISFITYGHIRQEDHGVKYFGEGLISIATGFMLIALRDSIPDLYTIIFANTLIVFGIQLIYMGFKVFHHKKVKWVVKDVIFLVAFILSFIYLTYVKPDINMRIIVISCYEVFYFARISFISLFKIDKVLKKESSVLSILFVLFVVANIIRIIWTVNEPPMDNFLNAGTVHSIVLSMFQFLPFQVAMGVIWMNNVIYEGELKISAMTDGLTGLLNRVAFEKLAKMECDRTQRYKGSIGIIMADLDYFKAVNDHYGHQAGDEVLRMVSKILKRSVRSSDLVGRYGGEEFVIVVSDMTEKQLIQLMEKLRTDVASAIIDIKKQSIRITMSLGGTLLIPDHYNIDKGIDVSDMALYAAKSEGRNKTIFKKME